MKLYWPCAVYLKNDRLERAFTYDAMNTLADALQTIETWKDWYKFDIRKAWVDVYERSVLLQKVHIGLNNGQILHVEDYQKGRD